MYKKRLKRLFCFFLAAFLTLAARLTHLQLVRGPELRAHSLAQVEKLVEIPSRRGNILDRKGRLLATSEPTTFNAAIILDKYNRMQEADAQRAIREICGHLGIDEAELHRRILRINRAIEEMRTSEKNAYGRLLVARRESLTPHPIIRNLPLRKVAPLEIESSRFEFMTIVPSYSRKYPFGEAGGHVLGYMWEIYAKQFTRYRHSYDGTPYKSYHISEQIGRSGAESFANARLRGERGARLVLMDNRNRTRGVLWEKPPVPGKDVRMTIDIAWQAAAAAALQRVGRRGAMVVMDIHDGEILVSVSIPRFDPATVRSDYARLIANDDKPLINRATNGLYPLGSVFKIVDALAALEEGALAIEAGKTYDCYHRFELGDTVFGCTGFHGEIGLREALKRSCNIFFYKLALEMGPMPLARWAGRLGLGQDAGLRMVRPAPGYIPSPANERLWRKGDTVNLSIGQGKVLATPLQVARMMAVFGNGGHLVRPRLFVTDPPASKRMEGSDRLARHIAVINDAMRAVVTERKGTAHNTASSDRVTLIGKTGTAQAPRGKHHGWFAGLELDADGRARTAFAAIIEDIPEGTHAGDTAALAVRRFYEAVADGGRAFALETN